MTAAHVRERVVLSAGEIVRITLREGAVKE